MSHYGGLEPERWTKTAQDCYSIGCTCIKCNLYGIMQNRCRMKNTVFALVRKYGAPNGIKSKGIIQ